MVCGLVRLQGRIVLLSMCLIDPWGVPVCFTPMMQQRCMGWDVMVLEV
jgi:hypothetical protein